MILLSVLAIVLAVILGAVILFLFGFMAPFAILLIAAVIFFVMALAGFAKAILGHPRLWLYLGFISGFAAIIYLLIKVIAKN